MRTLFRKAMLRFGALLVRAGGPRPSADPGLAMQRVVIPQARDRWRFGSVALYTPDRIEQVLRSAFAGNLCAQWELFDLMEDTWPRLQKNLNELKSVLDAHEWPVQAWAAEAQKPSAEAIRRKALLEECIWHTEPDPTADENDFEDTLRDLADAWGKGISVLELIWTPRSYEGGQMIGLKGTQWLHPRFYGYPPVANGSDRLMLNLLQLDSIEGREAKLALPDAGNGFAAFPPDKFLIGIAKQKTGHPIGAALLRPLAWWWAASNFTSEWLLNLAQIFGVPIRWATYALGTPASTIANIEEMLENMGSAAWGCFPAGTTIELKESIKSATDNPQMALLSLTDKICDVLVLGQTLTSEQGQKGSQALGKVHANVLSDRKKKLLSWVVKTLNQQFVPAFCRLNFGDVRECPYFFSGIEDEEDAKTVAETFQIVLNSGAAIPKQHFYESLGIPAPEEGDEVIAGHFTQPGQPGQPADPTAQGRRGAMVQAKDAATEKLVNKVLEDLTGVEAQWLAGAKPFFTSLVQAAKNEHISDEEFVRILERAKAQMPDLLRNLDMRAVAVALENAMGSAVVNGAVRGAAKRGVAA